MDTNGFINDFLKRINVKFKWNKDDDVRFFRCNLYLYRSIFEMSCNLSLFFFHFRLDVLINFF